MWQQMIMQGAKATGGHIHTHYAKKDIKEGLEDARDELLKGVKKGRRIAGRTYEEEKTAWQPWREAAKTSLSTIQQGLLTGEFQPGEFEFDYEKYTSDPGYQFAFQEGQKALERGAAARGKLLSGEQAKALQQYGQKMGYGHAYRQAREEFDLQERGKQQALQNWMQLQNISMPGMYETSRARNVYGQTMQDYAAQEAQAKAMEEMGQAQTSAGAHMQHYGIASDALNRMSSMNFGGGGQGGGQPSSGGTFNQGFSKAMMSRGG